MTKIMRFIKNLDRTLLALIIILVVIRICLPAALKYTINLYLGNKIEFYEGHIEDFDLTLYRGAYQIQGLNLWKKGADSKLPLIQAANIDLSLAWRALLQKHLLGDLAIDRMKLNFVDSESKKKKQFGTEEKRWNDVFSSLIPIDIESLKISNSEVHFVNRDYRVPVDLFVDRLYAEATNFRNTDKKDVLLPSRASIKGRLQKDTDFLFQGQFNLLENPIAFNMDAQMKDFTLAKLNDFFLVYGPFTFANGKLSIFSEVATREGKIKGYVKPFFEEVKMIANQERFISFKHGLTEILLGTGNLILRNPGKDAATRLEFEGALNSPDVDTWGAFWASLKNAFGTPLKQSLEGNINIKSVPKD